MAILAFAIGWVFVKRAQVENLSATDKFAAQYTKVPHDHSFVYADDQKVRELLKDETGVLFLGFPECPWCQALAPKLDAAAKAEEVSQIYYYNVRQARTDKSETYQTIVDKLGNRLKKDKDGEPRMYVPYVIALRNGTIVDHYEQQSAEGANTPEKYWTDERDTQATHALRKLMRSTKG